MLRFNSISLTYFVVKKMNYLLKSMLWKEKFARKQKQNKKIEIERETQNI